tara:strand:- start:311 stop:454 length:144 start_codon:yes stop_codon:yes gene_type:complete
VVVAQVDMVRVLLVPRQQPTHTPLALAALAVQPERMLVVLVVQGSSS